MDGAAPVRRAVAGARRRPRPGVGRGAVVVAAGVVVPVWMGLVAPNPPPVPYLDGFAHAVYGVVLGGTCGALRR